MAHDHPKPHPYIPKLVEQLEARRVDRREFLRTATLLGLAAGSAYAIAGKVLGTGPVSRAAAQAPQQGGLLRIAMRVPDLRTPHTYSWVYDSNAARQVNDYLTRTGVDNLTRPWLVDSWEPSEDLRVWTLRLRPDVTWHNGEPFVADHVIWNLEHMIDPEVGSSFVGLVDGFLVETDAEGKAKKWDANAIEKVDDHTIRLNGKGPQLAIPEILFHYPALILDPEENGEWGVGSNGTGAFTCESIDVGQRVVLKSRGEYWAGNGPYLDEIQIIDTGDDPAAQIAALAARQVDGQYECQVSQYEALKRMEHLQVHEVVTAQTGVVRMKVTEAPFDDPRVRKAMRLALDPRALLQIGHLGIGAPGEHHHVSPIHPEYADVGFMERDVEAAKALLAEAGHPDGIDVEITAANAPEWEPLTVQACAQMWQDAGIRAKINVVPEAQYWDVWTQVPLGFTRWTHRPLGVMVLGLAYRTGTPWNETSYSNPQFDELLGQAEATLDVDKRRQVMAEIQTLMLEDGPVALPLWRGLFSFWDKRVQGFEHHPTSYIFGEEIWLDEAA